MSNFLRGHSDVLNPDEIKSVKKTSGIQEACSTGGETKSYSTLLGSALSHRSYFLCRADKY